MTLYLSLIHREQTTNLKKMNFKVEQTIEMANYNSFVFVVHLTTFKPKTISFELIFCRIFKRNVSDWLDIEDFHETSPLLRFVEPREGHWPVGSFPVVASDCLRRLPKDIWNPQNTHKEQLVLLIPEQRKIASAFLLCFGFAKKSVLLTCRDFPVHRLIKTSRQIPSPRCTPALTAEQKTCLFCDAVFNQDK